MRPNSLSGTSEEADAGVLSDLIVMVVAGALTGYFAVMLRRTRTFKRDAVAGTARVVDRTAHQGWTTDGEWRRYYSVTLRFTAQDGRTVTTEVVVNSPRPPKPGRDVRVLYDPRNPEEARIDTAFGRGTCWQVPVTLVCAAVFVIALVALVRAAT